MTLRRKIATGLMWVVGQTSSQQIVGLAVFSVLAAVLGPRAYGLISMAMVVVSAAAIIMHQGLLEGLLQRSRIEPVQLDSMFWFVLGLGLLLTIGIFALAEPVARLYDEPELTWVIRALGTLPLFAASVAVPMALLRRELKFRTFAIRSMIAVVVGAVVGIAMALHGYGVWALVGNQLSQQVANVVVIWAATSWRPGWRWSWRPLGGLLGYGIQVVCIRGLAAVDFQAARFIVGYALGPVALGYLYFSTKVLGFVRQLFISPFNVVGMPAMARVQDEPAKVERLLSMAIRMANLVVYPAFIGIAVVAPLVVPILFGDKWAGAIPVLQVMTIAGLAAIYIDMYDATLRGLGRPHWLLITRAVQLLFTVAATLAAIPYGVVAVAAVLAAKGWLFLPVNAWVLRRAGGPRLWPMIMASAPIIIATTVMGVTTLGWIHVMGDELGQRMLIASTVAVGVATYGILTVLFVRPLLLEILAVLRSVKSPGALPAGE